MFRLILFLIAIVATSPQETVPERLTDHEIVSVRVGWSVLESIRKRYCDALCNPINGNSYLLNLSCTLKCPELYLPHNQITTLLPTSTTDKITTERTTTQKRTTSSSTTTSTIAPPMPLNETNKTRRSIRMSTIPDELSKITFNRTLQYPIFIDFLKKNMSKLRSRYIH